MKTLPHNKQFLFVIAAIALLFTLLASLSGVNAQTTPEWQPHTAYAIGDRVTYGGLTYECRQAHTSLSGWEPPNTPALWLQVEGGSPPTATQGATTTPTNTPSPATATPTSPPGGSCTAPAWSPSAVYVNGDVVSHNGREWRAKWWTQGEEPGTTGEWGVWLDLGACNGATPTPGATPTNTPVTPPPPTATATATPMPTATPCPDCGGDLPRRLLVGYWHNFDNGSATPKLRELSTVWDVVNVAFAEPQSPSNPAMAFSPYNATVTEFQNDVALLQQRGQAVLISIGGANGHVALNNQANEDAFVNSMIAIIETYNFNGLDVDLEGGSLSLAAGDTDFRQPTTPKITHFIAAVQRLLHHFGPDFILTAAPETAYVQGGHSVYGGVYGAYLPLFYAFHDRWDYIHVQHYNTGCMVGLDGRCYSQGTADFQVAMAEMLLYGFPVAGHSVNYPAFRQEQVAIGLPASPSAAGGGYTPPATVHTALNYLIKGQPYGGQYPLQNPAGYPDFRGLMTWSINWDITHNFEFSGNHRLYLDGLDP